MKRNLIITTLTAATLSLAMFGCSKSDQQDISDKTAEVYQDTKDAVAEGWNNAKDYTFEKSSDFRNRAEAISSEADAKIEKLKAKYAEQKASASRSAAMDKLTSARADLGEKIKALGNATADTWDSAKASVIAATKRVEAAYDDAVADHS